MAKNYNHTLPSPAKVLGQGRCVQYKNTSKLGREKGQGQCLLGFGVLSTTLVSFSLGGPIADNHARGERADAVVCMYLGIVAYTYMLCPL